MAATSGSRNSHRQHSANGMQPSKRRRQHHQHSQWRHHSYALGRQGSKRQMEHHNSLSFAASPLQADGLTFSFVPGSPNSTTCATLDSHREFKKRRIHFHDDKNKCNRRHRDEKRMRHWKRLLKARCTERVSWTLSATLGFLVLIMQIPPIFMRDWVHIYEPRAINKTDEKGETIELPFYFDLGYFRACRLARANLSTDIMAVVEHDFPPRCVWNSIFTGEDLTDFSFATNAILVRLGPSTFFHSVGSAFTLLAFMLSISGHIRRNTRTLCSAIIYFIGGLSVMAGVLQLICVVDDEMYPRMRPTPSGEPSCFHFDYGLTFLVAALSFLPIQICIYLQTSAFFNRFPDPEQKASIVPGLNKLLQQVSLIPARTHQLGKCAIMPRRLTAADEAMPEKGNSLNYNVMKSSSSNYLVGLSANVSSTSSLNGANMTGRRRESRVPSRDFTGLSSPWSVHQEVQNADVLTAFAIRRPSSHIYLI